MNSSELRGFLTGLILGDGTIDKGITKRSFAIKSVQKDFIDMIEEEIKSCSGFNTKVRYKPAYFSDDCHHRENWEFVITAHPYFNKMYHYFYDDYRRRIIATNALKWLTPRGLANWYMSDGYICLVGKTKGSITNRRVEICTDRYTLADIHRVQHFFLERFNIQSSIVKRGKTFRLRILQPSYNEFFSLISCYIVPSMRYKMYLSYDHRPKWMSDDLWMLQEDLKSANPLQPCA